MKDGGNTDDPNDSDYGLPDDYDDEDDDHEYEAWKIRELGRLKRDSEYKEKLIMEQKEIIRRRQMTNEERLLEDIRTNKLNEDKAKSKKAKWKYLQKYYHKGVFYMDEDSIQKAKAKSGKDEDVRLKEYNEPTLEDKFDREKLPEVLQVKNFGKRGRTKYTHLVDQDTTKFDQPLKPNDYLKDKYMSKRGGVGDIDYAGKVKRQKKGEGGL